MLDTVGGWFLLMTRTQSRSLQFPRNDCRINALINVKLVLSLDPQMGLHRAYDGSRYFPFCLSWPDSNSPLQVQCSAGWSGSIIILQLQMVSETLSLFYIAIRYLLLGTFDVNDTQTLCFRSESMVPTTDLSAMALELFAA